MPPSTIEHHQYHNQLLALSQTKLNHIISQAFFMFYYVTLITLHPANEVIDAYGSR